MKMMVEQKHGIHLNGEHTLVPVRGEKYYQVAEIDWGRLKSCIGKIRTPRKLPELIGSILLGLCGGALLSTIALPYWKTWVLTWRELVTVAVIISSGCLGGMLIYIGSNARKLAEYTKDQVNEEIVLMEKKWQKQDVFSLIENQYGRNADIALGIMKLQKTLREVDLITEKIKDSDSSNEGEV
jgi:hypothetical protein